MFRNALFQYANTHKNTQTTVVLQHSETVNLMPAMDPVDDIMPSEQKNIGFDPVNKTLHGVPIWKLFIDQEYHFYENEMYFDTHGNTPGGEPGYNAAMHTSFAYMLTNLHKRLDATEFKRIHGLCIATVKNVHSNNIDFKPGAYGMSLQKVSAEAKNEWESEKLIFIAKDLDDQNCCNESHEYLASGLCLPLINIFEVSSTAKNLDAATISHKVNQLFHEYYTKMEKAQNDNEKLSLIVSVCRKLEIGHFFADGNQRTIVFVILNKLLIENNFSPVILDNPIVFDGYLSRRELVNSVKTGMENFSSLTPKVQSAAPTKHAI